MIWKISLEQCFSCWHCVLQKIKKNQCKQNYQYYYILYISGNNYRYIFWHYCWYQNHIYSLQFVLISTLLHIPRVYISKNTYIFCKFLLFQIKSQSQNKWVCTSILFFKYLYVLFLLWNTQRLIKTALSEKNYKQYDCICFRFSLLFWTFCLT